MNLTEMRTAAREMYGDIDSVQFSDTQLLTYINFSVAEIARRLGFVRNYVQISVMDGSTQEGVGGVAVPADFHQEISVRWNGTKLFRMHYDDLFLKGDVITLTSGPPTHYVVAPVSYTTGRRRLLFWPYVGVTQAANVEMLYLARPLDLAAGADVPGIPLDLHMAAVFYTCNLMGMAEGDADKSTLFKRQYFEQMGNWDSYNNDTEYNSNPQIRDDRGSALYHLEY